MVDFTAGIARQLLRYDPETGKLFWRLRDRKWFQSDRDYKRWNNRFAGNEALTTLSPKGYLYGSIFGTKHYAHRVIWLMHAGELSTDQIDHINGDAADNRIKNLRAVSNMENCRNQKRPERNTSGHIGVFWNKRDGKWQSQIGVCGKRFFLGYFDNIETAVAARKQAEMKFGFHENHGRLK